MAPDDIVISMSVIPLQACPGGERVDACVEVSLIVQVEAIVNDGHTCQAGISAGDASGFIGNTYRVRVTLCAFRGQLIIDVPAAEILIDIQKLLFGDQSGVQCLQSVLHPCVVVRAAGYLALCGNRRIGLFSKYVTHAVVDRATNAVRILLGMIVHGLRNFGGAVER